MPPRRKRRAGGERNVATHVVEGRARGGVEGEQGVIKKPAKKLRVLFMHGLESGPQGRKTHYLKHNCKDVLAPDMEISAMSLSKKRSIARQVLAQRRVQLVLGLIVASTLLVCITSSPLWPYPSIVCLLLALYIADRDRILITQTAIRSSISGCVEVMSRAIKRFEPDVVVGSSWGGAVAVCCMEAGVWEGPTVLLAPAYYRVVVAMGGLYSDGLRFAPRGIIVAHSRADQTIDFRDTRRLVRDLGGPPAITLVDVVGDDHRLDSLVHPSKGRLTTLIEQAYHSYWHGNETDHQGNPQMPEEDEEEEEEEEEQEDGGDDADDDGGEEEGDDSS